MGKNKRKNECAVRTDMAVNPNVIINKTKGQGMTDPGFCFEWAVMNDTKDENRCGRLHDDGKDSPKSITHLGLLHSNTEKYVFNMDDLQVQPQWVKDKISLAWKKLLEKRKALKKSNFENVEKEIKDKINSNYRDELTAPKYKCLNEVYGFTGFSGFNRVVEPERQYVGLTFSPNKAEWDILHSKFVGGHVFLNLTAWLTYNNKIVKLKDLNESKMNKLIRLMA